MKSSIWVLSILLVTACSSVAADACSNLRIALEQRDKARGEHAELAAEHAVADATEAVKKTIAVGSAAELMRALSNASAWWEVAQWSAMEWSVNRERDFPMLFDHLADTFLALDLATIGTATWVCALR